MPFSHYSYVTKNGKRKPIMLYQLDGTCNVVRRDLIALLTSHQDENGNPKQSERLAKIPDECQPATSIETFHAMLVFRSS